jgi:polyphosphate kinase
VLDPGLKKRVIDEGLKPYLDDDSQAWEMDQDGTYQVKTPRRGKSVSAQGTLIEMLASRQAAYVTS